MSKCTQVILILCETELSDDGILLSLLSEHSYEVLKTVGVPYLHNKGKLGSGHCIGISSLAQSINDYFFLLLLTPRIEYFFAIGLANSNCIIIGVEFVN